MTTIAILGSGRVATSLAAGLARAGHTLVVGVRNPEGTRSCDGPDATFVTLAEAIAASDVVFNATPGDTSVERLAALADALADKLLIDVANATGRDAAGRPSGLLYPTDSLAERLQAALPGTRVVKTLNTMRALVMSNPAMLASSPTVFLSGNDTAAKTTVRTLLADMAGGRVDARPRRRCHRARLRGGHADGARHHEGRRLQALCCGDCPVMRFALAPK